MVTIGTLICKVGVSQVLLEHHSNFFVHCLDDGVRGDPICEGQKPVELIKELMELYSTPNDWIFSSPMDIGMYICAYMCIYI